MALVHMRALSTINVPDESGQRITVHVGDWFKVGKQKAIELIEQGQAEIPASAEAQRAIREDLTDCGILVLNGTVKDARDMAGRHAADMDAQELKGDLYLPWPRTLIWDARYELSPKQVALGFVRVADTGRYSSWEMAAMLRGNEMLANEIGDAPEQTKTKTLIGDLHLPVYETSAVWARKTTSAEAMIAAWGAELRADAGPEHAFLRALYCNRVLLCTLPAGWLRRLG